jgi:ferric-dicitrate binding protein FerR (iron transport regulator)
MAAAVALLVSVGYFFYTSFIRSPEQVEVQLLATTDQPQDFWLPDSTHVFLNKNSRLSFDRNWKVNQRNVSLEGEAFFEVVRDTKRPFRVKTGSAVTEVLGTSFNVKAYEVDEVVEVKVATGKVALKAGKQEIILVPGDKGTFEKTSAELKQAPNEDMGFMSWGTKRMVFDNSRMEIVAQTLKTFYNVEIEFAAPQIADCHFTGIYDQPDLDSLLSILSATTGLTVNKYSDTKIRLSGSCHN